MRILQSGEVFVCNGPETLLQGMARTGRKGIPAGCLNGGCGVCKVSVMSGRVELVGPMSRAHVSVEEEARGICLACRVRPLEALEVDVVGKLKKALTFKWAAGPGTGSPKTSLQRVKEN